MSTTARAKRVREAMCPSVTGEDSSLLLTTQVEGQTTNLQRLAEPSQLLKSAIVHLINYQVMLSWPPGPCLSSPSCSMMRTRSVRAWPGWRQDREGRVRGL